MMSASDLYAIGASSMTFEVVYFYGSPDFNAFMDVQQEIYLQVAEQFAARGIQFALPAQTLQLRDGRADDEPAAGGRPPQRPANDPQG